MVTLFALVRGMFLSRDKYNSLFGFAGGIVCVCCLYLMPVLYQTSCVIITCPEPHVAKILHDLLV